METDIKEKKNIIEIAQFLFIKLVVDNFGCGKIVNSGYYLNNLSQIIMVKSAWIGSDSRLLVGSQSIVETLNISGLKSELICGTVSPEKVVAAE